MYRIICAKWGTLYPDTAVDKLYEVIRTNCSVDFTFECFTKFPQHLEEYKQKLIPFIVKRPLPNGCCEYWKFEDLIQLD